MVLLIALLLNHWHTTDCFCHLFNRLFIRLIDLTNTLQIFNYKYTFLMTNMVIIIIGLLVYIYNYLLLYTRFHSSPVEHENLRSKVVLMDNSTKCFKIIFWNVQKMKYRINVVSIFQNHDLLVKKKINIKSLKNSIAKSISLHNIYLIWYRYAKPRFHGNVRNPC